MLGSSEKRALFVDKVIVSSNNNSRKYVFDNNAGKAWESDVNDPSPFVEMEFVSGVEAVSLRFLQNANVDSVGVFVKQTEGDEFVPYTGNYDGKGERLWRVADFPPNFCVKALKIVLSKIDTSSHVSFQVELLGCSSPLCASVPSATIAPAKPSHYVHNIAINTVSKTVEKELKLMCKKEIASEPFLQKADPVIVSSNNSYAKFVLPSQPEAWQARSNDFHPRIELQYNQSVRISQIYLSDLSTNIRSFNIFTKGPFKSIWEPVTLTPAMLEPRSFSADSKAQLDSTCAKAVRLVLQRDVSNPELNVTAQVHVDLCDTQGCPQLTSPNTNNYTDVILKQRKNINFKLYMIHILSYRRTGCTV